MEELALSLDKEPTSLFYKDEGGKSNFLTASCVISSKDSGKTFPIGNLRLSPRLVYESGGEIEDEDDIFNIISVEPKTITATNEKFTVNFRIEKVSRRKDGKKFRVRFDVNKEVSQVLDYISIETVDKVETRAITVLSKRKNHSNHHSGEESRARKRRASTSTTRVKVKKEVKVPLDFIRQLTEKIDSLESQVVELRQKVERLERKNALASPLTRPTITPVSQGVFSRGQRVHSLMFDQYEDISNNNCRDSSPKAIKRSASSTTELFELLSNTPQMLN